jgi:hypothetical protein
VIREFVSHLRTDIPEEISNNMMTVEVYKYTQPLLGITDPSENNFLVRQNVKNINSVAHESSMLEEEWNELFISFENREYS